VEAENQRPVLVASRHREIKKTREGLWEASSETGHFGRFLFLKGGTFDSILEYLTGI
jgi:hypothetical protein